jgi:hypothetical protein
VAQDGRMTQAEADAIRAEGRARGEVVCICAEIVDAEPTLFAWLFERLIPGREAQAEHVAEAG